MTPKAALAALAAHASSGKAAEMAAYHKAPRIYLGVANPAIDAVVKDWRAALDVPGRVALADGLWRMNIHEARIAATKLLTQARLRPDADAWALIAGWVPDLDAWAIADHAMNAGQKRLRADPARIEEVARWTQSPNPWIRRAALVITLPWTKQNHPKPGDIAIREQGLGWAGLYADDPDGFIQKSVAGWLCDLSRHDPDRVRTWLAHHGARLKPFARKQAGKYLP